MQYRTCPGCGANLDFGERCYDCEQKKSSLPLDKPPFTENEKSKNTLIQSKHSTNGNILSIEKYAASKNNTYSKGVRAMSTNNSAQQMIPQDTALTASSIFSQKSAFELAARMADAFSKSTIVPKDYQGNAANCLIALEMANRIGTAPMMVMQNLYIVNGRPGWSSQFIIAMINNSKKYKTELQYDIKKFDDDNIECYAYAIDRDGRKVVGPTISMKMAKAEGWLDKNGSKWKTMPEVMLRYRAASFFGRLNCPDMVMGIYSADEVIDISNDDYKILDTPYTQEVAETEEEKYSQDNPTNMNPVQKNPAQNKVTPTAPERPIENAAIPSEVCTDCGSSVSNPEKNYSLNNYGRPLCRKCQIAARKQG